MIPKMEKIIVVDFDKTLVRVNSFPRWVMFLLRSSVRDNRFYFFIYIFLLLGARKVGIISHLYFKKKLMALGYPKYWDINFSKTLGEYLDQDLVVFINGISDGKKVIISSAAPVNYLNYFDLDVLNNCHAIQGSKIVEGVLLENIGIRKYEQLSSLFDCFEVLYCFTDHYLDFPLLNKSRIKYLVNPDVNTVRKVNFDMEEIRLINTRRL